MRWPIILAVLLMASPVMADITGPARIIDGDTIDVAGQRIRFHGIDAPESGQTCVVGLEVWLCGQKADHALYNFIGTSSVTCQERDVDRYGRIVATCAVRGRDIGAWMVLNGWALAYRRYSLDYVDQERRARIAALGMWRGDFVPPWEWRRGKRLQAPTALDSADGCLIKGNIAKSGEYIFHVPGGRYYENTKINTASGERWFCTEAEAIAAGWRKARR